MDNIFQYLGRESAWHGKGETFGRLLNVSDIERNPKFQTKVFKSQLRDRLGRPINAYGTFWMPLDQFQLSKGTGELADKAKQSAQFIGSVGENYTIIPWQEGALTIDSLIGSVDGAKYETAGILGNWEKVWLLADLGLRYSIGGDEHRVYLLFVTGFDGSCSFQFFETDTRVVCQNTLQLALSRKAKQSLVIRHTKNAKSKLESVRDTLSTLTGDVKSIQEKMLFLAGRKVTRESLTAVLDRLFPKSKEEESTRRTNILSSVVSTFESNDGNAFPEQRGSMYNLLNAVTNYADHQRSAKGDNRALSAAFGSGADLKSDALTLILEASQDAPILIGAAKSGSLDISGIEIDALRAMYEL